MLRDQTAEALSAGEAQYGNSLVGHNPRRDFEMAEGDRIPAANFDRNLEADGRTMDEVPEEEDHYSRLAAGHSSRPEDRSSPEEGRSFPEEGRSFPAAVRSSPEEGHNSPAEDRSCSSLVAAVHNCPAVALEADLEARCHNSHSRTRALGPVPAGSRLLRRDAAAPRNGPVRETLTWRLWFFSNSEVLVSGLWVLRRAEREDNRRSFIRAKPSQSFTDDDGLWTRAPPPL